MEEWIWEGREMVRVLGEVEGEVLHERRINIKIKVKEINSKKIT